MFMKVLPSLYGLSLYDILITFFNLLFHIKEMDSFDNTSIPLFPPQSYYFDRDDQALHNFAKFFRSQSHEEREHAEKLMKLQNQRGGRIFLQDVKV